MTKEEIREIIVQRRDNALQQAEFWKMQAALADVKEERLQREKFFSNNMAQMRELNSILDLFDDGPAQKGGES